MVFKQAAWYFLRVTADGAERTLEWEANERERDEREERE
jgi:hypothetical protein